MLNFKPIIHQVGLLLTSSMCGQVVHRQGTSLQDSLVVITLSFLPDPSQDSEFRTHSGPRGALMGEQDCERQFARAPFTDPF